MKIETQAFLDHCEFLFTYYSPFLYPRIKSLETLKKFSNNQTLSPLESFENYLQNDQNEYLKNPTFVNR